MQRLLQAGRGTPPRCVRLLIGAALASLSLSGCANFWDDVTSADFHVRDWYKTPDPFVVLQTSHDGDRRAAALRSLQEPKQHGGSDKDQDFIVKLLTTAANQEPQALCRLGAIQALANFRDPRVLKALQEAYFNADPKDSQQHHFPVEISNLIQCQALLAMGGTRNPDAVTFLVNILREPKKVEDSRATMRRTFGAEFTAEESPQQAMDRRMVAARALGNFKQYQATEALVRALKDDLSKKDVAFRDCVHESLQQITNQHLPPDPKAWEDFLHQQQARDTALAQGKEKKRSLLDIILMRGP